MSLLESLARLQVSLVSSITALVDLLARKPRHKYHQDKTNKELKGKENVTLTIVTHNILYTPQGSSKVSVQCLSRQQSDARCERVLKNANISEGEYTVLESERQRSESKECDHFNTVLSLDNPQHGVYEGCIVTIR